MLRVFFASWTLLLGMMLLMIGNGLQGTLLGIRGSIEGFETWQMSVVMSAYFAGFLLGSQLAPGMISRVGHVRVFAGLGSMISAVLVLYAAAPDWIAWSALRVVIGFCFAGVYVTAESWLNNAATNETRGQTLSLYMIVQMVGIITAQGLLNLADPGGYNLFVIASVLVSLAFTPILLSVTPAPGFSSAKSMGIVKLFRISPLGCVGIFLMGGIYSVLFGMVAVWGALVGLSVLEISTFVAAIYLGGLVFQYPIGALSDRMDRRRLIIGVAGLCMLASLIGFVLTLPLVVLLALALIIGGTANPLYSLLLAHTNDFLQSDDMAGASGGLLFLNGVGAVAGPLVLGWLMSAVGPSGFFLFVAVLSAMLVGYGFWRMSRRAAPEIADQGSYTPLTPGASVVTLDAAFEAAQPDEAGGGAHAAAR
ncbi:MFS transporter [Pararhodobacter sp. SW119]|uniref:MFS transporter n=1 Tax=Pararhodobacter sp. SW119 TaxID=2780075 RepID=UPI001AE00788|nr:MFS transporter [Pararhodobacter sp. SW119]